MPSDRPILDLRTPPTHPLLAVSILSADFGNMAGDCRRMLDLGADLLHVDVMDGHFAPNLTMGADMVAGIRRHLPSVHLDAHLMVQRPDQFVDAFAKAGTNHFSFHIEVCDTFKAGGIDGFGLIDRIHSLGMTAGIVINPPTDVAALSPYLERVDLVLVMSVNPGFSGQSFMPGVLDKASWIHDRVGRHTRVEMDGGLNKDTAPLAVAAGVDTLVTASALFGSSDPKSVIDAFHACPLRAKPKTSF